MGTTAKSCGRATARSTAPSWSETSTPARMVPPPVGSPTSMAPSSSPPAMRREGCNSGGATAPRAGPSWCRTSIRVRKAARPSGSPTSTGRLYFAGNGGVADWELWRSDGTAEGTTLVMDIAPGPDSSFPSSLIDLDGELYFTAERRNQRDRAVEERWNASRHDRRRGYRAQGIDGCRRHLVLPGEGRTGAVRSSGRATERRQAPNWFATSGPVQRAPSRSRSRTSTERCSSRRTSARPVSSFGRATGPRRARDSFGRSSKARALRIPRPSRR